jgi:hypothetical protein
MTDIQTIDACSAQSSGAFAPGIAGSAAISKTFRALDRRRL